MRDLISNLRADESGATAVEYGLILAMIFLAMIGAIKSTGNSVGNVWGKVSDDAGSAIDQANI